MAVVDEVHAVRVQSGLHRETEALSLLVVAVVRVEDGRVEEGNQPRRAANRRRPKGVSTWSKSASLF